MTALRPSFLRPLLLGLCLALPLAGRATDEEAPDKTPTAVLANRVREDVLKMSDFFDTVLPDTLERYNLVLGFTPRFSDARDREFIRYPLSVRYGLSDDWELFGGFSPFSPNPINNGPEHRWGMGFTNFGVRHDTGRFFRLYGKVTVGVEIRTPLGQPPLQVIDGYSHFQPLINASRKLPVPYTTFYTTYSYDWGLDTPTRARESTSLLKRDVGVVIPGLLYKPGEFGGVVEYSFLYIEDPTHHHLAHNYKVGVIWDVPLMRTFKWHLPGKWQIELAYKVNNEQEVGKSQGITTNVRWRTSLREIANYHPKLPRKDNE